MSYPGTWQQLGNFEARGQRINYEGLYQAAAADIPQGDRTGDPLADMLGLLGELENMPYSGRDIASSEAHFGATLGPRQIYPNKPYGRAHKDLLTLRIGPVSLAPPGSVIPPAPEGAVGYEWQTPDGTVTGGRIQVFGMQADGPADNEVPGCAGDWYVELGLAPDTGTVPLGFNGPLTFDNGDLARWSQNFNMPVDATASIDAYVDPAGRFQILGEAGASVIAFDDSPYEEQAWNGSMLVGVRIDEQIIANAIRVYYSVRPPLFRWLYATPQAPPALPPLRQFPRTDGRGASSAPRRYPAPRAAQASSRRRGGYF